MLFRGIPTANCAQGYSPNINMKVGLQPAISRRLRQTICSPPGACTWRTRKSEMHYVKRESASLAVYIRLYRYIYRRAAPPTRSRPNRGGVFTSSKAGSKPCSTPGVPKRSRLEALSAFLVGRIPCGAREGRSGASRTCVLVRNSCVDASMSDCGGILASSRCRGSTSVE